MPNHTSLRSRPERSEPAPPDLGRTILALFGLVAACLVCFALGATAGLLIPPSYIRALAGDRISRSATPRPAGSAAAAPGANGPRTPRLSAGPPSAAQTAGRPTPDSLLGATLTAVVPQQTLLVLGSDLSYAGDQVNPAAPTRSDTLLLVGVDGPRRRLEILSIPRDTMCAIPGHGHAKINAALAFGGPKLALQTVADLLRVPIDHWIWLRLDGLVKLVNLIGGVDLDVPEDMRYTDHTAGLRIDLTAGPQHLDGQQAHQFIRFRHDTQGDIGRIARQQLFLRAVAIKLTSPAGLFALLAVVRQLPAVVQTDLRAGQIAAIAAWARTLDPGRIRMVTLPGSFGPGGSWQVDPQHAAQIASGLLQDATPAPGFGPPLAKRLATNLVVLNGTHRTGLASKAARMLRAAGWTVWQVGDADRFTYATTRILTQTDDDSQVGAIAQALRIMPEVRSARSGHRHRLPESGAVDYTVILGQDFLAALREPMGSAQEVR